MHVCEWWHRAREVGTARPLGSPNGHYAAVRYSGEITTGGESVQGHVFNTLQLRTSQYRVRLYEDRALKPGGYDDTTNGSTFLETTDNQKEFKFTHDSGRVKNAEWGESREGGAASNLKRQSRQHASL
jgi:hypothetical protein